MTRRQARSPANGCCSICLTLSIRKANRLPKTTSRSPATPTGTAMQRTLTTTSLRASSALKRRLLPLKTRLTIRLRQSTNSNLPPLPALDFICLKLALRLTAIRFTWTLPTIRFPRRILRWTWQPFSAKVRIRLRPTSPRATTLRKRELTADRFTGRFQTARRLPTSGRLNRMNTRFTLTASSRAVSTGKRIRLPLKFRKIQPALIQRIRRWLLRKLPTPTIR